MMGQITKAFAELMTAAAEQGHHTPLTAWEQKQFAQAWLELQSVKAAGVQGDAARYEFLVNELGAFHIIAHATDWFRTHSRTDTPNTKESADKAMDAAIAAQSTKGA